MDASNFVCESDVEISFVHVERLGYIADNSFFQQIISNRKIIIFL